MDCPIIEDIIHEDDRFASLIGNAMADCVLLDMADALDETGDRARAERYTRAARTNLDDYVIAALHRPALHGFALAQIDHYAKQDRFVANMNSVAVEALVKLDRRLGSAAHARLARDVAGRILELQAVGVGEIERFAHAMVGGPGADIEVGEVLHEAAERGSVRQQDGEVIETEPSTRRRRDAAETPCWGETTVPSSTAAPPQARPAPPSGARDASARRPASGSTGRRPRQAAPAGRADRARGAAPARRCRGRSRRRSARAGSAPRRRGSPSAPKAPSPLRGAGGCAAWSRSAGGRLRWPARTGRQGRDRPDGGRATGLDATMS